MKRKSAAEAPKRKQALNLNSPFDGCVESHCFLVIES